MGRIYESLGESEKALEYYMRSLGDNGGPREERPWQDRLAERPGSELEQRRQNIRETGRRREGSGYYTRSLEIMEGLAKKDPGRTDWQRVLGVSLNNVGRIYEGLGEGGKALGSSVEGH